MSAETQKLQKKDNNRHQANESQEAKSQGVQSQTPQSNLIGQRKIRLEKVKKLRNLGFDPYPARVTRTHKNNQLVKDFKKFDGKMVTVVGRVMSWREHGKLIFSHIEDQSGKIQLFIRKEELESTSNVECSKNEKLQDTKVNIRNDEKINTSNNQQNLGWQHLELVDVGDFVQAYGTVMKTRRGEVSVLVKRIRIITKTIRPLPEKWSGLQDKEVRFRRRYLDMTMNKEVRERFLRKAKFWKVHREFLDDHGFAEINIPVLEHIPGGGDAKPFVTHMDVLDEDFYLRISHELPLKRLIGGGLEKVYDIGPRFRNEGLSEEHLPEHVAMEFYWAYADWEDGMKFIQELFTYVIDKVYDGQKKFKIRGYDVDFNKAWEILDFGEIVKKRFDVDVINPDIEGIIKILKQHRVEIDFDINIPRAVDNLWKLIRKDVSGPAFLINHPKYLSPLQKPSVNNPAIVQRFQPIIAGSELGNGWSELNDAVDQYNRFKKQQNMRDAGDEEAQWLDIDYVEMLEYGMPPTFGWGHSERLFWFLEDVTAREGVPFPQLKSVLDENTREIYGIKG